MMKLSKTISISMIVLTLSALTAAASDPNNQSCPDCVLAQERIEKAEKELAEAKEILRRASGGNPTVTLGPLARNADGSLRRMSHADAVIYCATRGGLPTAKQLALALNPKGVSDTARDEFYRVSPKGQPEFYYSHLSYDRPMGNESSAWFWSVSVDDAFYAYLFSGFYGGFAVVKRGSSNPVRCLGR